MNSIASSKLCSAGWGVVYQEILLLIFVSQENATYFWTFQYSCSISLLEMDFFFHFCHLSKFKIITLHCEELDFHSFDSPLNLVASKCNKYIAGRHTQLISQSTYLIPSPLKIITLLQIFLQTLLFQYSSLNSLFEKTNFVTFACQSRISLTKIK